MQFKLDENLPPSAADLLRSLGHGVITHRNGMRGSTGRLLRVPQRVH